MFWSGGLDSRRETRIRDHSRPSRYALLHVVASLGFASRGTHVHFEIIVVAAVFIAGTNLDRDGITASLALTRATVQRSPDSLIL